MNLNTFIENFIEAVEIEDVSTIEPATVFREIEEWDSLAALSTIAMADEEYGVTITNKDLKEAETIEELWQLIERKKKDHAA